MRISDWSSDVCSSDLRSCAAGCRPSCRRARRRVLRDQRELGVELARAEARTVETLTLRGAAVEHVDMLGRAILRPGPGGQREMRLDHIGDVDQNQRRALLAVLVDDNAQPL